MRIDTTSALQFFPVEIILVDSFDRILDPGTYADLVDDHEAREFLRVDLDDALRTLGHIVRRGPREPGGGYEHALVVFAASIAPAKFQRSPSLIFDHGLSVAVTRRGAV